MTERSQDKLPALQQALDSQVEESIWRKILHTLAVTGVADNQQLIQASGLHRDKLRRILDKMTAAAAGFPPLFSVYEHKIQHIGQKGVPPKVFRLGESGAALCQADGLANARPCRLEEPRPVLHALGMLDIHLAARAAGLQVITDRNLDYDAGSYIRPDNLVSLPEGVQAIYESEQDARSDFLGRILRSLEHKLGYFQSSQSEEVSQIIRMLLDVPRGKLLQHTLSIWRQALEIQREKYGEELPFRLFAMPLSEFLANPDWNLIPQAPGWVDLTSQQNSVTPAAQPLAVAAQALPVFSNLEQRMVLAAMLQHLLESGSTSRHPQPDSEFLYLMRLIYLASHDFFAPALQRSGVPHNSLYLLDQYLRMNPQLRQLIEKTTQMDARRIHWNQSTALHRMQIVIDAFLEYHGWQSDGPLRVYSFTPDYQTRGPRRLSVAVEVTDPEILMSGEVALVPGKQEVETIEQALAWVLTALFSATHHLGLKKPPFW